jgi:hypothetical protein
VIRGMTLLWTVLSLVVGIALFTLKHEVQELEGQLARVNRDIYQNQEAIHVLKAEWSFLNDPARLRDLSITVLGMQPVRAEAVASLNQLSGPLGPAMVARAEAISQNKGPKATKTAANKPAAPAEAIVPRKIEMAETLAPKPPHVSAAKTPRVTSRPDIEPMASAILSIAGLRDIDRGSTMVGAR